MVMLVVFNSFNVVQNLKKPDPVARKMPPLYTTNTQFCMSLHYNADNNYLFVNGKVIFKFKTDNKNVNFPTQFCL